MGDPQWIGADPMRERKAVAAAHHQSARSTFDIEVANVAFDHKRSNVTETTSRLPDRASTGPKSQDAGNSGN